MLHQDNYQPSIRYLYITFIYWLSFGNTIKEEISYTQKPDLTKMNFRNQTSFWTTCAIMGKQIKPNKQATKHLR